MDHEVFVYKVDYPVQSSLSSSLVLTQYACLLYTANVDTVEIASIISVSVVLSEASFLVILNNSSHFDNVSILFP